MPTTFSVSRLKKHAPRATAALLFLLLCTLCFLLFRRYLVGPYQYIFLDISSDTIRINLPTYYMLWDALAGGGAGISMEMGIGTSVVTHADTLFDPFTYLSFLGGRAHIANLVILPVLFKIICAGLACYFYLRSFSLRRAACSVASVAYAFSGYMLIMGRNYAFATVCVYLPLILLGLERFMRKGRFGLLLGSLFITAIYFYYFFYMCAIIVAVYAVVRFVQLEAFALKKLLFLLLRIFCIGGVALLLSSVVVLPTVLLTLQSARLASTGITAKDLLFPNWHALFTALARMFGADSAGVFEVWNCTGDYFELATFTSALCALIFPQYLCGCPQKQRRTIFVTGGVVLVAILLPIVSYALNGFSSLTHRWSFVLNLLLALCCALGLHTMLLQKRINRRVLLASLAACCGILLAAQTALLWTTALPMTQDANFWALFFKTYVQHPSTLLPFGILAVYCLVLLLSRFHRFLPLLLCGCLLVVMSGEIFLNYYYWLHNSVAVTRGETRPESSFFDDSFRLIKTLQAKDDTFYRIAKNYDSVRDVESGLISDNDAIAQGFYGLQSYHSLNQPNYVAFLQRMGIFVAMPLHTPAPNQAPEDMTGTALNYINGVGTRYDVASYLGAKYYLVKEPFQPSAPPNNTFYYYSAAQEPAFVAPDYFTLLTEQDGIRCYRNEAYFPFAFSRSEFVLASEFALLANEQKDTVLARFGVMEDALAEQLSLRTQSTEQALQTANEASLADSAAQYRAQMTALSWRTDGDITVSVSVPADGSIVIFTTPYENGWRVTMDGAAVQTLCADGGMLGVAATAGAHTFHLVYTPQGLRVGICISLLSLLGLCVFLVATRYCRKRAMPKNKQATAGQGAI